MPRLRYNCILCGHKWKPRTNNAPDRCPKCKSPDWNKPRIVPAKGIVEICPICKEEIGHYDDIEWVGNRFRCHSDCLLDLGTAIEEAQKARDNPKD